MTDQRTRWRTRGVPNFHIASLRNPWLALMNRLFLLLFHLVERQDESGRSDGNGCNPGSIHGQAWRQVSGDEQAAHQAQHRRIHSQLAELQPLQPRLFAGRKEGRQRVSGSRISGMAAWWGRSHGWHSRANLDVLVLSVFREEDEEVLPINEIWVIDDENLRPLVLLRVSKGVSVKGRREGARGGVQGGVQGARKMEGVYKHKKAIRTCISALQGVKSDTAARIFMS